METEGLNTYKGPQSELMFVSKECSPGYSNLDQKQYSLISKY